MGVHGLWRLIEPSGKPVPLETLENKVLAVDVSIWLHQAIKGFQDSRGALIPNAHLLGIYHRICKLLYFRVKPVFVFDGGVPVLKKQTIAKRNQQKLKNLTEAEQLHQQLLNTLLKHAAVNNVLGEKQIDQPNLKKLTNKDDLFALPPIEFDSTVSSVSDDEESSSSANASWDLHSIDTNSAHFKSLPVDVRHEILTELKETRKQSSWGRLHELPKQSNDFSAFQMGRLLKRQAVQTALEDAEKEMGGHSLSLAELEAIMKDQGVLQDVNIGSRIASDENTRYLLIKNLKETLEKAKTREETAKVIEKIIEEDEKTNNGNDKIKNKGEKELEKDIQKAIELSLQEMPSTSSTSNEKLQFSFLNEEDFTSDSENDFIEETKQNTDVFSSARSYMMEYSGLTSNAIVDILENNKKGNKINEKIKKPEVRTMIDAKETFSSDSESDFEEVKGVEIKENDLNGKEINGKSNKDSNIVESSSESDFEEVEENVISKPDSNALEIVINVNETPEDDLFSDIFNKDSKKDEQVIENRTSKNVLHESVINSDKVEVIENITTEEPKITEEKTIKDFPTEQIKKSDVEEKMQPPKPPQKLSEKPKMSKEEMQTLKNQLEKESASLTEEKSSKERLAGNITDQMCKEAQELLRLFGIPYVVAPMEAEAQCAYLNEINLTDGTITDDSDIWLFGGKTVYKNFFNHSKQVMEFNVENIVHHFKLTREQMILLALLVGSDYTVGLQGVGPVTALEILAAFPPSKTTHEFNLSHSQLLSGLGEFRRWFKKGCAPGPGRTSLKSKLKNVNFTENFPSLHVVQAYMEPTVDTSKEAFTWAKPNILGLTEFARIKFGWTKEKSEEILSPIVKRLNDNRIQKSIKEYFKTTLKVDVGEAESKMSKRVKVAVNRLNCGPEQEEEVKIPRKRQQKNTEKEVKKVKGARKKQTSQLTDVPAGLERDEDVKFLLETAGSSSSKVEEVKELVENQLKNIRKNTQQNVKSVHKKEVIPQREREKSDLLKRKLKAIEVFRKSKQGSGYVQKRQKAKTAPKEEAELSESSSSD